ncbi:MAG: radical SAM protein [Candidatus Freyarchaeota archaeon]|nr:radical SAM protein [Candidatus Jordarchaeia archaeon]
MLADDFPLALQVEVSSACNLDCFMCQRRSWVSGEEGLMPLSLFRKLEGSLCEAERVILYGIGEPLMNSDIVEMVAFARRVMGKGGEISLSTNGVLLTPKLAGMLVDAGLTSLYVSLDSLNEEKLKKIRRGIDYVGALENLKFLLKKFGSDVEVGLEYVVMRENLGELPEFVAEAAGMDANHIFVSHIVPYFEEAASQAVYTTVSEEAIEAGKELLGRGWRVIVEAARFFVSLGYVGSIMESSEVELLSEAWRKAEAMGVELNVPLLLSGEVDVNLLEAVKKTFSETERVAREHGVKITLPPVSFSVKGRSCPYVEKKTAVIRWDGMVAPCQEYLHDHQLYVNKHSKTFKAHLFGDIKKSSLKEIWGSGEYTEFRKKIEALPETVPWCGNCPYSTLKCWFVDGNELDCYGNSPSCSECIYSTGMAKCNI